MSRIRGTPELYTKAWRKLSILISSVKAYDQPPHCRPVSLGSGFANQRRMDDLNVAAVRGTMHEGAIEMRVHALTAET